MGVLPLSHNEGEQGVELRLIQGGLDEKTIALNMVREGFSTMSDGIEEVLRVGWFEINLEPFKGLIQQTKDKSATSAEVNEFEVRILEWEKRMLRNKIRTLFDRILKGDDLTVTLKDIDRAKILVEEAMKMGVEQAQTFREKFSLLDQVARRITPLPKQDFSLG